MTKSQRTQTAPTRSVRKTKRKPTGAAAIGPGPGRPKGSVNRVTREFRDTVRQLLEDNAANVGDWLEQVATGGAGGRPDPARALELLAKLAEYAAPKLGRIEHAGPNGGPIEMAAVDLSHLTAEQLRAIASIRVPGHDG
jgi:hypothetical protein